ncbi:MAG: HK97 gp10 family phage protein [Eubacteriales bacterium]|nr:HK97 gp10 family phage protein [Eubacteriales bacterium]
MERILLMAKWGKCDFRELEALRERMAKLESETDAFCEACARELAARLLYLVKKRTPVGTPPQAGGIAPEEQERIRQYWSGYSGGTLRRGWTTGQPVKASGGWTIEVINNVFYASYVEYGHRQQPGRYVPALGKQLKQGWVRGKFMLTISQKDVERAAPAMLQKKLEEKIREAMDAE